MRFPTFLILLPLALLAAPRQAGAQEFREADLGLTAVGTGNGYSQARMSPGDFDKDGDLDMLVYGMNRPATVAIMEVWRNEGGRYTKLEDFKSLGDSLTASGDWADLDGDGYYELITWLHFRQVDSTGNGYHKGYMRLYGYDPGTGRFAIRPFRPVWTGLLVQEAPLFRFSDLDQDGYPEIFFSAHSRVGPFEYKEYMGVTRVYRNLKNLEFEPIDGYLEPVQDPAVAFGDFDQDGRKDVFASGVDSNGALTAKVYRNAGSGFTAYASLAPGIPVHSADWADYNRDGKPDLAMMGGPSPFLRLYTNTGTGFQADDARKGTDVNLQRGMLSFGDVDGDGDPDLLACGESNDYARPYVSMLLVNDGGDFFDLRTRLLPFWNAFGALADYDGDGHPDVLLSGTTADETGTFGFAAKAYRNIRGDLISSPLPDSLGYANPRWADFDQDGDLDLVACKPGFGAAPGACMLFRNEQGKLARRPSGLDGAGGEAEITDIDGDGRMDVLLAGRNEMIGALRWFRNTGADFVESPLAIDSSLIPHILHVRSADFDRDGRPDLAAWGEEGSGDPQKRTCWSGLLRNLGQGGFAPAPQGDLPGLCSGEMEWGDYDRDGDPDLVLSGDTSVAVIWGAMAGVFRNDDGKFAKTPDRPVGLSNATVDWGDYDGDGDLDFVESGEERPTGGLETRLVVYRFVSGRFEEAFRPNLMTQGDARWLDFDNDGDLDLLASGHFRYKGSAYDLTPLYRNDGNGFTTVWPADFTLRGELGVGDFDADGDLDVAFSGVAPTPGTGSLRPTLKIFRNTLLAPNSVPSAPGGLSAALGLGSVKLGWGPSADAETGADAMQYNLRMGTAPGFSDVVAPGSSPNGYRLAPAPGNAGALRSATLGRLAPGTYYWSVQGIDMQGAGSPFSSEGVFSLGLPAPDLSSAEAGPGPGAITLRWRKLPQSHFRRYFVHYGTGGAPVSRMDSLTRPEDTALTVTGLANGTPYHFRLSAEDQGGNLSPFSSELVATPDGTPPAIPAPLSVLPGDRSVTLSWPAASETDFHCYLVYQRNASGPWERIDSIPDIAITSKAVGGLKNGTPYGFLVAAADRVGNRSGFSPEAVAVPLYLVAPSSPELAFGKIRLRASRDSAIGLVNASALRVAVDSARIVNDAFVLPELPASLPAQAETSLTVRFAPGKAAGGDFSGVLKLYYGGAARPLEIELTGTAAAPPWCGIERISPADAPWDVSPILNFMASANDSDNAGQGDRIPSYLWSSSLAGPFGENASGFAFPPSALGIGTHEITLRVVDNEGDTSLAARAVVVVRNRKPLARIDSILPLGLILRESDRPRFRCTAHDLDEGAGPDRDSLRAFALFSTLQGRITGAKDTVLDPSSLSLGLHGFFAMAVDDEGDTSWSDTQWVPVQAGVGLALIAAGADFDDRLYFHQNIAPTCNWAYSRLRQRGFTDSLITYLNPVGWQSIGADYHRDSRIVDVTEMTVAALRERILGFRDRVRNGVPLLVSLIGHGGRADLQNGKFFLGPSEAVTPDSLDAWLDTYDGGPGDSLRTPIVLVLDFCYAGAFIPKLRSATQNRIVIASAGADRQAYFQNGQSFSYAFFKQIARGGNLAQAFSAGVAWSDANALAGQARANPQANADLDDMPNGTSDYQRMAEIFVGGSQQNQAPEAVWKEVKAQIQDKAGTLTLRAVASGPIPVDTAWFALLAPDFKPPAQGEPFGYIALERAADGSFGATVKLDRILFGDYMVLVYGTAGGSDMLPLATRAYSNVPVSVLQGMAERFDLGQNFPNPALGQTWVPFSVTQPGRISLVLWDMRGAEVRTLVSGRYAPGRYLLRWDGRDNRGRPVPPGAYTYRLAAPEGSLRKKLIWR